MIEYLIAWLIFTLCGALAGALITGETGEKIWILICSIGAAVISGVLLLVIWAMIAVSQFFCIPLIIIIIAVVIVAWLISRR